MLLQPTWICATYHTTTKRSGEKMLFSNDPEHKRIIKRVYQMENKSLCEIAHKIIPRRAVFGPFEGDSLRFAFNIPKLSRCYPEPYIVVWFDESGLYISGSELGNIKGWWRDRELATSVWTMRQMKESLGAYLDWLTHLEAYRDFCRENRDRIL